MSTDARYDAAAATNQSNRGWVFTPEPPRQAITLIDVLRVLFRPATLASLAILGLCVMLLVVF